MSTSLSHKLCGALLALLTLVAAVVVCFGSHGLNINTDLRSLSPALQQTRAINDSLDSAAAHAAERLTLVLMSPSAEELEDASEALTDALLQHQSLRHIDSSEFIEDYIGAITRYRFNFLTNDAQQILKSHSDQQLLELARRQLYSRTTPRVITIDEDPTGYLNGYVLEVIESITSTTDDTVKLTEIAGESYYYATHALRLPHDSLQLTSQTDVLTDIQALIGQLTQDFPGLKVLRSGMVFFASDAASKAKADISLISSVSSIAILLLLLTIFRRAGAMLLPAASILGGSAFAFAISHFIFGSLHVFTLVFGASLIGVVVDYSLHYFYLYREPDTSAERHLHKALLLSLITSVIGYTALSLSGLQALQQIALFSALGLTFAWLTVITFARYVLPPVIHDSYLQIFIRSTLRLFTRLPTGTFAAAGVATMAILLAMTGLQWPSNDSPRAFFAASEDLVTQEMQVSTLSTDYEPARFVVIRGNSTEQVFARTSALQKALSAQNIRNVLSVNRLIPSPAQQRTNYDLNRRLYGSEGIIERFLVENQLLSLQQNDYETMYRSSGQVLLPDELFAQLQDALPPLWAKDAEQVYSFLLLPKGLNIIAAERVLAEHPHATLVSAVEEASRALAQLRRSALILLCAALAIIALFMSLQFGARKGFQLVLIPAGAIGLTLLLLAASGAALTLFHVMALFLVLGLGMDYVIFSAGIPGHYQQTLAAIVLSALTSLLAFGLLSLSSLPAVSAFGLTVLIGNFLNLFGCFFLTSRRVSTQQE